MKEMTEFDDKEIAILKLDEITADIVKSYLEYSRTLITMVIEKQSYSTPFKDLNDDLVITPDELINLIDRIQKSLVSVKD
ncbi:MAG: hypothetical protein ACMUIE_00845 [Thermoplasmatota archaeon]